MRDDDVWFEPKRFGYGAGFPVSWQGWVLVLGYAALAILAGDWLGDRHPVVLGALLLVTAIPLMILCAHHTRGGWSWRWGERD